MNQEEPYYMPEEPKTALFDLDGTLLPWDTQVLFLNFVLRRHGWRRLCMIPYVCALPWYLLRVVSELTMKKLFLSYLWGLKVREVEEMAEAFAGEVVRPLLYERMVEYVEEHKAHGDTVYLVTASPSIYAHAIGRMLGVDAVFSSEVEMPESQVMPFLPVLPYGNHKGEVKVRRLRALWGEQQLPKHLVAYSDSMADEPMLDMAGEITLVNPSERLVRRFEFKNPRIERFALPWQSKWGKVRQMARAFLGL